MRRPGVLAAVAAGALCAPAAAQADATVTFRCCDYAPTAVTIAPGESVTWTATGGDDFSSAVSGPTHHPLKFINDAQPSQTSGTTTRRTFQTAGTFRYYCTFHGSPDGSGMAGTVTVRTGGAGPQPSPAPAPFFGPAPAGGVTADPGPPQGFVQLRGRRSLAAIRSSGLAITVGTSKRGRASASLRYGKRTVGRASVRFTKAGERRLTLRLGSSGRRALAALGSARLRVVVVLADRVGNEVVLSRRFTAR